MRLAGTPPLVAVLLVAVVGCGSSGTGRPRVTDGGSDGGPLDAAAPSDGGAVLDLAVVVDARTVDDLSMAPRPDLTQPPPPPDLAMAPPPDLAIPPGCNPRVNEVLSGVTSVDGGASWEFVELYNPCPRALDLTGWKLVYRAANNVNPPNGADGSTLVMFQNVMLPASGYLVFGGPNYPGMVDGALASGLATSGAVGIRDPGGLLVDSVAWGAMVGNGFIETTTAPTPPGSAPPGTSLSRIPNGVDTDDNSKDFAPTSPPTPRAANK